MAVHHGGKLIEAIEQYGGKPETWVDLSTGVSPFTYSMGAIPESIWNRLPETNDGLEQAAQNYYGTLVTPLAVAGSQAAIQLLPTTITDTLGRCGKVAIPSVGYKEHQHAWQHFTHYGQHWEIEFYDEMPSEQQMQVCDVVVLINPNNPTGFSLPLDTVLAIHQRMEKKRGWLVIDEAFMDCTPLASILTKVNHFSSLIVLRSVGKFFGLAGTRTGFVFSCEAILEGLAERLGPWTLAGPSRYVVKQALQDTEWQREGRRRIAKSSQRLGQLLSTFFAAPMAVSPLFITVSLSDAPAIHQALCIEQVFTRLSDEKNALRFGLPADEWQWQKLSSALEKLNHQKALG